MDTRCNTPSGSPLNSPLGFQREGHARLGSYEGSGVDDACTQHQQNRALASPSRPVSASHLPPPLSIRKNNANLHQGHLLSPVRTHTCRVPMRPPKSPQSAVIQRIPLELISPILERKVRALTVNERQESVKSPSEGAIDVSTATNANSPDDEQSLSFPLPESGNSDHNVSQICYQ